MGQGVCFQEEEEEGGVEVCLEGVGVCCCQWEQEVALEELRSRSPAGSVPVWMVACFLLVVCINWPV